MFRVRVGLMLCTITLILTACAPTPRRVATPAQVPAPMMPDATAATWTAEPGLLASSTVKTPGMPSFPSGRSFAVDRNGRGKAVARFMSTDPSPEPWHRVARFIVDSTEIDGISVEGLTLSGRLSDDTVVTTTEQLAFDSEEFVTVSRRVRDILRDDPDWRGLDGDPRVSVTFERNGNGPVDVRTIRVLDRRFRSLTINDFGPQYNLKSTTDPLVRNALLQSAGTTASIVAYIVDFKQSPTGGIRELYVGKSGALFRPIGYMSRPRSAFGHSADPRLGPEPAHEAAQRRAAIAAAESSIAASQLEVTSSKGEVFAYLIRVRRADGSHVDVLVNNSGLVEGQADGLNLQPWPPASK